MINRVIIAGRLGADPEVKSIGQGRRIARLSVGTNESWHSADGEPKEATHWHTVVLFKKQSVEFAERNLHKGDLVGKVVVRTGRGDVTLLAKAERPAQ